MNFKEFQQNISKAKLSNLIKNFSSLSYFNIYRKFENQEKELRFLRFMNYFNFENREEYIQELKYLNELGRLESYPYKQLKTIDKVEAGFDKNLKLPYVVHRDKKLYFPKNYSIPFVIATYKYYVETENIIGGGYTEKAPHQYIDSHFKVEKNDILLDIGCAEALFALEHVDVAKRIFVFENDPKWFDALDATFAPYKNKVTVVKKLVSNINSKDSVTLENCLKDFGSSPIFIKMDIEGMEMKVLKDNEAFLKNHEQVKVSCTTYHHAWDAQEIGDFFTQNGFATQLSDGYLLYMQHEFKPPYFRKGLIRATKLSDKQ